MEKFETNKAYWKGKNGETKLLSEMEDDHLQKAYLVMQKRQLKAYSSLEFSIKMEDSIKFEAKRRKLGLPSLDEADGYFAKRFIGLKELIKSAVTSIKRKNKKLKDEAKVLLQEEEN